MQLNQATLGQKVRLFVGAAGFLSTTKAKSVSSIEATLVGIYGATHLLGWKSRVYSNSFSYSTGGYSSFTCVSDINDYLWFCTAVGLSFECEIVTQGIINCEESTSKPISECALGDEVQVYIDGTGMITSDVGKSVKMLSATIIGKSDDIDFATNYGSFVLGWKTKVYRNSSERGNIPKLWHYIPNQADYRWGTSVTPLCPVIVGNKQSTQVVAKPAATPDWKFFQRSTPGECPCGGTPGVCPDHPL